MGARYSPKHFISLITLNSYKRTLRDPSLLLPCHRGGNRGLQSFNHFPTITQTVKSRDGSQSQDNVTPSPLGSCTDQEEGQLEAGTKATVRRGNLMARENKEKKIKKQPEHRNKAAQAEGFQKMLLSLRKRAGAWGRTRLWSPWPQEQWTWERESWEVGAARNIGGGDCCDLKTQGFHRRSGSCTGKPRPPWLPHLLVWPPAPTVAPQVYI